MNKHFHNFLFGISVLPALLIMPAMAANVSWDGIEPLDLGAGDTWSSNVTQTVTGSISGAGTVSTSPTSPGPNHQDTVLTIAGDISEFTGTFYTVQYGVPESVNAVSSIIFKNWDSNQGFNLTGNGNFIFDGTSDVKIANTTLGASIGFMYLNGSTLSKDSTWGNVSPVAMYVNLGANGAIQGISRDNGTNATLSGYNFDKVVLVVGSKNVTSNGDVTANISNSTFNRVLGITNGTHVNGDINLSVDNLTASQLVAQEATDTTTLSPADTIIIGDINIDVKNSNIGGVYGQQFAAKGTLESGINGDININVENSTVGDIRGVTYTAGDYEAWNANYYNPAENINITVKDSVITSELLATGAYPSAGNVKINVLGNTVIGYTDATAQTESGEDGWIIAGAQRPGARIASTEVNLNTDGTIRLTGDVNAGSRQKSAPNDSDDGSVTGDAVLNMFGGGNVFVGGDVRAYHVAGARDFNLNNIVANVAGTVKEFSTINIGDDAVLNANALTMNSGDALNIVLTNNNKYGRLSVDTLNANGADLNFFVSKAGIYDNVVTVDTTTTDFTWNLDNSLYVLSNDAGTITATQKSVEDIAADNNLTTESATAVSGLVSSTSGALNDLAVLIQEKLATGDVEDRQVVEQVTTAINPEVKSVIQSMSTSMQDTIASLATSRMALPTVGRAGGDDAGNSSGVWVQGIFNKAKQSDDFNGYTRGIAGGLDGTLNKQLTLGAGYSYAHSDITASARDTEIDSLTVFAYAQYKPTSWYMNSVVNYTKSSYNERGTVLGTPVTADYNVNSYGANIAAGYDHKSGLTPELAIRYMHIGATDYTNSLGIKNKFDSADYLTASAGTRLAFKYKASKKLALNPELRYALKYDMLSDEHAATVTMPGVDAYVLDGDRLSRIGGEFGLGMTVMYEGLNLSLNYDIEVREDYTSQSGRMKFRYNF
ncbi:MAG: autotransporter domain-containing protein [Alphaproteobacteria bacterium]|nr:autotransporter domain-containing protein [Alphaproteobacteria bacterium]